MKRTKAFELAGERVGPGQTRDLLLPVSQSYSGTEVSIPVRIVRGESSGPILLLTAAVHGDELNGTGIIREIALAPPFELTSGTLILVPVVNILGFERQSRYLPDRRDLNRSFPGSASGSLASRVAHALFSQVVSRCDYLIDLHTAAVRRTNYPNVRGDLSDPKVKKLARAFGCELVLDHAGIKGSLRRSACRAGHPAIILEAGEVWKVEPRVVEAGVSGIRNVLIELGMAEGDPTQPPYRAQIKRTSWLRADNGGWLQFHAAPGDVVEQGQPIATCTTLLGTSRGVVTAPEDAIVMGVTTLPSVKPGDPVCHLAIPRRGIAHIKRSLAGTSDASLRDRLQGDLASSLALAEPEDDDWD